MSIGFRRVKEQFIRTKAVADHCAQGSRDQQKKINVALFLTLCVLSVLYLVQVNTLATKGYTIKDLQKKIAFQQKENERLQMKNIEQGSLGTLQQKMDGLQLVRSDKVDYISPSTSVAVLR